MTPQYATPRCPRCMHDAHDPGHCTTPSIDGCRECPPSRPSTRQVSLMALAGKAEKIAADADALIAEIGAALDALGAHECSRECRKKYCAHQPLRVAYGYVTRYASYNAAVDVLMKAARDEAQR